MAFSPSPDCHLAITTAWNVAEILLDYQNHPGHVEYKSSRFDPASEADRKGDALAREKLSRVRPNDEILSEESKHRPATYKKGRIWVVDPLDGSKDYLAKRDCFTTIIGLMVDGVIELGVVTVPARHTLYVAQRGKGAYRVVKNGSPTRLHVSKASRIDQARLVTRHKQSGDVRPIEQDVNKLAFQKHIPEGSIALKACMIAEGKAEAHIHTNKGASKWDTLGPSLIVQEAGGEPFYDIDGNKLDHTRSKLEWDRFVVMTNNATIRKLIIDALHGKYK